MQPYAHLAAVAAKAGVAIKRIGQERRVAEGFLQPTWSWDFPGSAGGCGLPTENDAVEDAVVSLGLMDRGDGNANWHCEDCDAEIVVPATFYAHPCKRCGGVNVSLRRSQ